MDALPIVIDLARIDLGMSKDCVGKLLRAIENRAFPFAYMLKLGVWLGIQIEHRTPLELTTASAFLRQEGTRTARRRTSRFQRVTFAN